MPTNVGPCPCPQIQLAANAVDQNTVNVAVSTGGPVTVTLGLVGGTQYTQHGMGPFTFADLEADTVYSVVARNDCGEIAATPIRTVACPAIVLVQTADTVNSVTVTVNAGGPVQLTLGSQEATVPTGASHTFTGLAAGTGYTVRATSACGSTAVINATTEVCPLIVLSQVVATTTPSAVTVQVNAGGPVTLTLGAQEALVPNGGSHTFTGLTASTDYSVHAASTCGETTVLTARTADCPAIAIIALPTTSTSATVAVTAGGPVDIQLGDQTALAVPNGGNHVFTGLTANTTYNITATNACGSQATTTVRPECVQPEMSAAAQGQGELLITLTVAPEGAVITGGGQIYGPISQGGTALFTGLTPGQFYIFAAAAPCGAVREQSFQTPACPTVQATVSSVSATSLTVTVDTPEPVKLEIYSSAGTLQGFVASATGSNAFSGLTDNQLATVVATNSCGSEWRQVVKLPTEAKPCASKPLYKSGYGFVNGDVLDPEATVLLQVAATGLMFSVYPTAAAGRTAPVLDASGLILGYAANRSECSFDGCCTPEEYLP